MDPFERSVRFVGRCMLATGAFVVTQHFFPALDELAILGIALLFADEVV